MDILQVGFIFFVEGVKYLIHWDYPQTVKNVASSLAKKNILYTKIFQSVALNHYLVDNVINNEILKYTDSVPFTEEDIDHYAIEKLKEYLDFDPQPINSGMISLVYKMKIKDKYSPSELGLLNPNVIVKIKRRNIEKKLNDAIAKVRVFGWVCSFIPFLRLMHIPVILDKLTSSLNEQLDFQQEIKNIKEASKACEPMSYIKIPLVANISSDNVIVMEYLNGTSITKVDKKLYETYGKMIIKYAFSSFFNNIMHGDLHSGNILFLQEDGFKIGIIDFGLMVRLDTEIIKNISNIFPDFFTKPGSYLAKKIFVYLV